MTDQPISLRVLREKYATGPERSLDDVQRRVARALAAVESEPRRWERPFFDTLRAGFLPAGRILAAAGTGLQTTLINSFVEPVGDSLATPDSQGRPGIYVALREAAETLYRGGGIGYNFSAIRPKGAVVRGAAARAAGPVAYLRVFDRSCDTVESAGARRGAQMGILACDHPDIVRFITAKRQAGELSSFNLSVGVTDDFIQAVMTDRDYELIHLAEPAEHLKAAGAFQRPDGRWVYQVVRARALWDTLMRSTYEHAEPGVVFLDRLAAENNLHYCEWIEATNSCAEQPLPPYGGCCLGSINLTRFVEHPFTERAAFAFQGVRAIVPMAVRMLDNVLDLSYWPLPAQRAEAMTKRRLGLGFTGLGDALVMVGRRYDTEEARWLAARIAETLRDAAYRASVELAKEKGRFPRFEPGPYLQGAFIRRLPADLQDAIAAHGIRNSHLLSIAPCGTISLACADNVSNGIEPPFAWTYIRRKREPDGAVKEYPVEDHAYRLYRAQGGDVTQLAAPWVTALEIAARHHMQMLEAVQPYIDSAIAKTVNVPKDYPFEDFKDLYLDAWKAGLKGLATYRPNPVVGQVWVADPAPRRFNPAR